MHGVASVADRSVQKIIQVYSTSGAVHSFAAGKRQAMQRRHRDRNGTRLLSVEYHLSGTLWVANRRRIPTVQ
jgi:hypothetical protein